MFPIPEGWTYNRDNALANGVPPGAIANKWDAAIVKVQAELAERNGKVPKATAGMRLTCGQVLSIIARDGGMESDTAIKGDRTYTY